MYLDYLRQQIEWSKKTFGDGRRTNGIIEHIRSELLEIEQEPDDLEEWCDVVILALDGAWRTGHTPKQIIEMLEKKQQKNFAREWPDLKGIDVPVYHKRLLY